MMTIRRVIPHLTLALALLLLTACQTPPKAAIDPADYNALYAAGRYNDAYDASTKAAGSLRGGNRETASLIAGQSAFKLGRSSDADKWLRPLLDSSSSGIAGRAASTLGSVAKDRGEHRQAADLFTLAGDKLTGDDAARAYMYAGDSRAALGQKDQATALFTKARDKVESDVQLRVQIGDRLAGIPPAGGGNPRPAPSSAGAYTVQAGAFSARDTAERLAAKCQRVAPARIVTISKNGRTLYAVHVGRFATKSEANSIRTRLGTEAIVTDYIP